jgi:hypothetical protein
VFRVYVKSAPEIIYTIGEPLDEQDGSGPHFADDENGVLRYQLQTTRLGSDMQELADPGTNLVIPPPVCTTNARKSVVLSLLTPHLS